MHIKGKFDYNTGVISNSVSLTGLVRAGDFEIKMFIRGSTFHDVQLFTAHVRSNAARQTLMRMVPSCSKSQKLFQEAALALRTYALVMQSLYSEESKKLTV
jgi:hypothetical protein